jgi:hypothetical protein
LARYPARVAQPFVVHELGQTEFHGTSELKKLILNIKLFRGSLKKTYDITSFQQNRFGVFVINQPLIRPASYQPTVDNRVSVIDS